MTDNVKDVNIERGRDEAYLEIDVDKMGELVDIVKNNQNIYSKHKHIVLKCGRVELSDANDIFSLEEKIHMAIKENPDMNSQQIGVKAFLDIFRYGLNYGH